MKQITLTDLRIRARNLLQNPGTNQWQLVYTYDVVDASGEVYQSKQRVFNVPAGSQAQISALDDAAIAALKQAEGL